MTYLSAVGPLFSQALGVLAYGTGLFTAGFSVASVVAGRKLWARRGPAPAGLLPAVTVLKPIKGLDSGMYDNLASFLRQDYADFQVIFCVQSSDDPALAVLERLRRDFPKADLEIVVSNNAIGYNPKVSNLSNAAGYIKHGLLMISDSDVRVERDFLRRAVAPLSDPKVGMSTCFYVSREAQGLGALLEALSINAHFIPQAAVASSLGGMRFAMGAVMLVRRDLFDRVGGFESLSRYLADDYRLGRSIQAAGSSIAICDSVVSSIPDTWPLADHFLHILRWARTVRVCQPVGYAASFLLYGTPLLACYALLGGGATAAIAALCLALLRAGCVTWIHLAYLRNPDVLLQAPALLLSDFVQFFAWAMALKARDVSWRGERFRVLSDGRLVPLRAHEPARAPVAAA